MVSKQQQPEQKSIKQPDKAKAKPNSKATTEHIIQNRSFKLIKHLFQILQQHPLILYSNYSLIETMGFLRKQHKQTINILFGSISALLSIVHFLVLGISVFLAHQIDQTFSQNPDYIAGIDSKLNIPFSAVLGLLAFAQLSSSIVIVKESRKQKKEKLVFLCSLVALFSIFANGVILTVGAINYDSIVKFFEKSEKMEPSLLLQYYALQIDATMNFLFSAPMLLTLLRINLASLLQEQRKRPLTIAKAPSSQQSWLLGVILLTIVAHTALIVNIYQFAATEDSQDYSMQSTVSSYTYYVIVEVGVCLMVFSLLFLHTQPFSVPRMRHFKSFMHKKHIILTIVMGMLFQWGLLCFMLIKTVQFYIVDSFAQFICVFQDCTAVDLFRQEVTAYLILTAATITAQFIQLKRILAACDRPDCDSIFTGLDENQNNQTIDNWIA